jgi:putative ABC transport system permease protein
VKRRDRMMDSLDQDIRNHIDIETQDNIERGMSPKDARHAATLKFGNVTRIQEDTRDVWSFVWLEQLSQDLRYGVRALAKTPGVALLIILTLSLGIGSSTLAFNMARQWVLNAVSFPHSEQLTVLWEVDTKKGWQNSASAPDFMDWCEQNTAFASLSAWTTRDFNLTGKERPERILGARVSANLFQTLGAQPVIGRSFRTEEEQAGGNRVAILNYGLWHDRFNANPEEIGKKITLDGETYSVIGVMPEDFHLPLMGRANLWVPLALTEKERSDRVNGWLNVVGRLKPGVTVAQAQQSMDPIAQRLEKMYPASNTNSGIFLNSLRHEVGKHVGDQGIYMSFCVCICILLISCANVAGILLARAMARQKEITLRISLGAGRLRIVRQLLTENIWLFLAAAALGVLLATWGGQWVTGAIPFTNRGYLPNYGRLYADYATIAYSAGIAVLSAVIFGLAPALHSSRPDLAGTLKDAGSSASVSAGAQRMRKFLIVLEVSLALMSLVPAGLMIKWLKNVESVDLGFRPEHVLTAQISLPETKYGDLPSVSAFYDRLLERVRALPQITSSGVTQYIPFGGEYASAEMFFASRPAPDPGSVPSTAISSVTPGYLPTLGLQMVRGRFVSDQDGPDSLPVMVINQTLANRHFAGQDPLGQKIQLGGNSSTPLTIVGIVKDLRLSTDFSYPASSESYVPFSQTPARSVTVVLRSSGDPLPLIAGLREAVASLDPDQPVSQIVSLSQLVSDQEAPFRIFTQFSNVFGLLALFLAAIGIYGVMAFVVSGRTKEIGIRMTLGATPRDVMKMVLTHSLRLTFVGILLGLGGAFALAQLLAGVLFGVSVTDPGIYLGASVVLAAAILLASYLPAQRAAQVAPLIALKYE